MNDELLTTKQVQEYLKVDRITVYRMLDDGRIKGIKVGNQWRFPRSEIYRLLGRPEAVDNGTTVPTIQATDFPVDCVERLQSLFAGMLEVGAVTINLEGDLLTEPVFSNPFCEKMISSPETRKACQQSWRRIAQKQTGGMGFQRCHAGLCYLRAPVHMDGEVVAWMVTGQFYTSTNSLEKGASLIREVAERHNLDIQEIEKDSLEIPVLKHTQQLLVKKWSPKVAETVQSMLCERSDLVSRLEKIAEISAIHPSLKNLT
jgi:excisionase family DNA binding protein